MIDKKFKLFQINNKKNKNRIEQIKILIKKRQEQINNN